MLSNFMLHYISLSYVMLQHSMLHSVTGASELLNTLVEQCTNCDGPCVTEAQAWCQSIGASYYRWTFGFKNNLLCSILEDMVSL